LIYESKHDEDLDRFTAILAPTSVANTLIPEFATSLSGLSVEDPSKPRQFIKEPLLSKVQGFLQFINLFEEFAELSQGNQLALQNLSIFFAYWLESLEDYHLAYLESAALELSSLGLLAESSATASISGIRTLREYLLVGV
jgi:hypothetical protein